MKYDGIEHVLFHNIEKQLQQRNNVHHNITTTLVKYAQHVVHGTTHRWKIKRLDVRIKL
jgi:hypothetical protein